MAYPMQTSYRSQRSTLSPWQHVAQVLLRSSRRIMMLPAAVPIGSETNRRLSCVVVIGCDEDVIVDDVIAAPFGVMIGCACLLARLGFDLTYPVHARIWHDDPSAIFPTVPMSTSNHILKSAQVVLIALAGNDHVRV